MSNFNKHTLQTWLRWEYLLIPLYCLFAQLHLGLAPFSFEDHFIFTQVLHLIIIIFIPLQFRKISAANTSHVYMYGFGFLIFHLIFQTLFSFFFIPVCQWSYGLGWYILQEIPSIFILTSLCIFCFSKQNKKWLSIAWIVGFIIFFFLFNLYDLLETPTLFILHPTIGYFPGPIFDTWIPIYTPLVLFRIWTLTMGYALFKTAKKPKSYALIWLMFTPLLFRGTLGFFSSHEKIQKTLSNHYKTEYATIYSYKNNILPHELAMIDLTIKSIANDLGAKLPSKPIDIYVYQDDLLKKKLTGSQFTMIGNPRQKALHLLDLSIWDELITHELTHVIASSLSTNPLRMNLNMSVTEGAAMFSQRWIDHQSIDVWAKAILQYRENTKLTDFFSTHRFYQLPSLHAYALSGSFVSFLIHQYGVEKFHDLYLGHNLESVYQVSSAHLEKMWKSYIDTIELTDIQYQSMLLRLNQKPTFQQKCIHEIAQARYNFRKCETDTCKIRFAFVAYSCNTDNTLNVWKYFTLLLQQQKFQKAQKFASTSTTFKETYDLFHDKIYHGNFEKIYHTHPLLLQKFVLDQP
ncbi:MAG: hypothetical protein KDD46_07220, partial [Bdellovibrionales bacterium]|nr:hypothetical protein [Bdellovibrionales bacterium]